MQLEGRKIQKEVSSKKIIDKKFNFNKILPSTKQLKRWNSYAKKRALEWASDAEEESFNIYISVNQFGPSFIVQILFVSEWKNEELIIYLGKESMSIDIAYKYGKIECRDIFSFDGKILKSGNGISKEFKGDI